MPAGQSILDTITTQQADKVRSNNNQPDTTIQPDTLLKWRLYKTKVHLKNKYCFLDSVRLDAVYSNVACIKLSWWRFKWNEERERERESKRKQRKRWGAGRQTDRQTELCVVSSLLIGSLFLDSPRIYVLWSPKAPRHEFPEDQIKCFLWAIECSLNRKLFLVIYCEICDLCPEYFSSSYASCLFSTCSLWCSLCQKC